MANTEEIIIGPIAATLKSPSITSLANTAPAIGALNVAAIPAAAPQATKVFILCAETWNN